MIPTFSNGIVLQNFLVHALQALVYCWFQGRQTRPLSPLPKALFLDMLATFREKSLAVDGARISATFFDISV